MAPTLEDLLQIPPDQITPQHVHMLGLAPDPIIPPAAPAATPIAKMTPPAAAAPEPALPKMTPPNTSGVTLHYHEAPEAKAKEPKAEKPSEDPTGFRAGTAPRPEEATTRSEVPNKLTPPSLPATPTAAPLSLQPGAAPVPAALPPLRPPVVPEAMRTTAPAAEPTPALTPPAPPAGIDQSLLNAPKRSLESFRSREAEPRNLSLDTTAGGPQILDKPGTSGSQADFLARRADEAAHPWGTPENHPGFLGKLAHGAAKVGNILGDIFAPATMMNIPGTDLYKRREENIANERLGQAQTRETAADLAKAKEQFEENTERINQQKADTGDARVAELERRIDNEEKKTLGAHEVALRKLGLKPDPQNPAGPPIPLTRDEMSDAERGLVDYKVAQADGVKAKALYQEYLQDPKNPANQEKLATIKNMAVRAGIAAENLGLRKKEFLRDTYGTDENGDPIPGVSQDEQGRPVGTKIAAKNDKQREFWEKNYEKPANDSERAYQMYQEAQRAYNKGDLKTGAATMLALSQHIGTTFGQIKGSRQTQELIKEHKDAIGLVDKIERYGESLATGQQLTADQMKDFGDLIANQRRLSWEVTAKEAHRNKLPNDFLPADLGHLYQEAPAHTAVQGKAGAVTAGGGGGGKAYTQADVDAAVEAYKAKGLTAKQIEDGFKAKGYTKQ